MSMACMQLGAKATVDLTPCQRRTGCGHFQRNPPTGGAANGMPLKIDRPSSTVPLTVPPVTSALCICAFAGMGAPTAIAAASTINPSDFLQCFMEEPS
jgi:hypothetical protein